MMTVYSIVGALIMDKHLYEFDLWVDCGKSVIDIPIRAYFDKGWKFDAPKKFDAVKGRTIRKIAIDMDSRVVILEK